MPILNLKKSKRIRNQIRLTTQRIRLFVFTQKNPDPYEGFVFIGDLNESQMSFYVGHTIRSGSYVQISFEQAAAKGYKARVLVCNRMSLRQSFLGTPALNYRATIQFNFSSEFEREQFLKYFNDLKNRFLFMTVMTSQTVFPEQAQPAANPAAAPNAAATSAGATNNPAAPPTEATTNAAPPTSAVSTPAASAPEAAASTATTPAALPQTVTPVATAPETNTPTTQESPEKKAA